MDLNISVCFGTVAVLLVLWFWYPVFVKEKDNLSSDLGPLGSPANCGLQKYFYLCVFPEDTLPSTTDAEELLKSL